MSSSFDSRNDILTRYNYERERRRRSTQAPVAPQMMSAHEPVVNPNANINPFQNDFTPNTNTMSMQQIAGQVAPQPQQPFLERMVRGAASLPIGIAGLAEGMATYPLSTLDSMGQSIAKHAGETAAIASDIPMNPFYGFRLMTKGANALGVPGIGGIEPQLQQLQEERKQAYITNPLLAPLDVAGLVGAGQATSMLSKIGRKSAVPKIIADAVAPEKPKVDVPEVVQKPIRSETPIVEQPTSAAEVVGKAKDAPTGEVRRGELIKQFTDALDDKKVLKTLKNDFKIDNPTDADIASYRNGVLKMKDDLPIDDIKHWQALDDKVQSTTPPALAPDVTNSRIPSTITEDLSQGAGKISTAPAKVQDAGATPAQSIETPKPTEYDEFLKKNEAAREEARLYQEEQIRRQQQNDAELKAREDERIARTDARAKETAPKVPKIIADAVKPSGDAKISLKSKPIDKKYYRNFRDDEGGVSFEEVPNAKPISIKGYEEADLFVAKDREGKSWVVSEGRLGSRITSGRTRAEAIDNANQLMLETKDVTIQRFNDQIEKQASQFGISPRYAKPKSDGGIELGALGTPSALHSTMGAVGRVAEKSMIPIQYIAKKIDNFMEKKGLSNPFGTPEIVLKNTGIVEAFRDATAKEHSFVAEQSLKLKEILGGRVANEKYLAEMFRHLDNPQAKLNKTEQGLRGWFDDMLNQVNEFRVKRGEEPINYTQGYVPHIFDKAKELLDADQSIALPRKAQNRFANTRVGAEGYEKDLVQALELYTRATARDMYINDALHTAIPAIEGLSKKGSKILHREVVTDPDGTTKYFNSYRLNNADMWSKRGYAEAFVREQIGLPTTGQRFLKQVGINPRTSQKVSNMATGLIYRNLLGAAIDTGVKNLSQITHTLAENGYAPTMKGIGRFLTPEGVKVARSEHLLKEFDAFLLTKDMPGVDKSTILKQFDDVVLSGPMRFTEFVNRGIAYHTALDDALKAGKAFAEAHDIALKAVRKTQFEYNKMGTSPFMRGPFTRPMAQFTTFPTKTSEMIFQWATEGATGRAKLLRYFATTGALVYGGKELGVELGNIFFDPTKTVDPDSKGGFELPISGRKVKIDLTRLGSTGFAPQGFMPTVTKPYKYISDLMEKDRTAKERTVQAFREFVPGGRFGGKVYDVATGSEYRDERGRLIRKDTKGDAWLKLLGGRPSNQDIMRNKKEEIVKIEDEYYETRRKIIDTQLNGDIEEARQMIADFSEKYPYLASRLRKSLKQGRKDERKKKQMSSDERFMDNSMRQRIEQNL